MLNDEKIKSLIKEKIGEDEIEGYYVYGVVSATIGKVIFLGSFAAAANKYYLINITNKKVHIYGIDMLGNPKDYTFIPMEEIKNVKFSDWMFGIGKKVYIELFDGSKIKLKANKHLIAIKGQKHNLIELEKRFSSGTFK